jgi:meso-butanediol dehydrogenase / (S,S)-butanediol dehydrogenase / diacetyl reductase
MEFLMEMNIPMTEPSARLLASSPARPRFSDQVVLITGGGSGIGREMALRFAHEGASLVVADRRIAAANGTVDLIAEQGGSALATETDVSQSDQVEAMAQQALERFGKVDILVNNAGLSVGDTILDFDEADWDLNVDVVLKAVYLCSRALLPQMIERGHGVILNIASVNGLMAIGESAYSAAKAGMISLTGNMAIHYGDKGVRVVCIAPGTIETPIWSERLKREPHAMDHIRPWYPLGRVGTSEDVAKAALFLCSDDASWITGITLPVDGGLTAGSYMFNKALQGVR